MKNIPCEKLSKHYRCGLSVPEHHNSRKSQGFLLLSYDKARGYTLTTTLQEPKLPNLAWKYINKLDCWLNLIFS